MIERHYNSSLLLQYHSGSATGLPNTKSLPYPHKTLYNLIYRFIPFFLSFYEGINTLYILRVGIVQKLEFLRIDLYTF